MIGTPDTTRGRLYQMRPSRFAMRFTAPKGDRIVADGRFLWLYTPSTTPGQVIRSRIPKYGPNARILIAQYMHKPSWRHITRNILLHSLRDSCTTAVITLDPRLPILPSS